MIFIISSDENELRPLAHSEFWLSKTLMWSPFLNLPETFFIPAANKLLPLESARLAPSSIKSSPLGEIELIIHFFLASNLEILGKNQVQLFFSSIFFIGLIDRFLQHQFLFSFHLFHAHWCFWLQFFLFLYLYFLSV